MNFWTPTPERIRNNVLRFLIRAFSLANGTDSSISSKLGVMSDSKAFIASAWRGSSPFIALRRIMPGMSRRLISLVPSKIRLIRSSR